MADHDDVKTDTRHDTYNDCGAVVENRSMFDKFGFLIVEEQELDPRCHEYEQSPADMESLLADRIWNRILSEWKTNCEHGVHPSENKKTRSQVRHGVPMRFRARFWKTCLDTDTISAAQSNDFDYNTTVENIHRKRIALQVKAAATAVNDGIDLDEFDISDFDNTTRSFKDNHSAVEQEPTAATLHQIELDVFRTLSTHCIFMERNGLGQNSLFNVLAAYARYNPNVGYCQGMSSIAAMLLLQLEEEDVFWSLVSLFERPKYLAGYYGHDLGRIQHHCRVLTEMISLRFPRVQEHFSSVGLEPLMFACSWFMTLFTELQCWDAVLALWDLFLLDGVMTIFRVALAIIGICKEEIMTCNGIETLLPFLQTLPVSKVRRSLLVPATWGTPMSNSDLSLVEDLAIDRRYENIIATSIESMKSDHFNSLKRKASDDSVGNIFKRVATVITTPFKRRQIENNTPSREEQSSPCGSIRRPQQQRIPQTEGRIRRTRDRLTTPVRRRLCDLTTIDPVKTAPRHLSRSRLHSPASLNRLNPSSSPSSGTSRNLFIFGRSPIFNRSPATSPFRNQRSQKENWRYDSPIHTPSRHALIRHSPKERLNFRQFSNATPLRQCQKVTTEKTETGDIIQLSCENSSPLPLQPIQQKQHQMQLRLRTPHGSPLCQSPLELQTISKVPPRSSSSLSNRSFS